MADQRQTTGRPIAAPAAGSNLADVLERVLDKGIVIAGDIKLLLADIEVLTLQIRLVIVSVDKAREIGLDWWTNTPAFSGKPKQAQPESQLEERVRRLEEALGAETEVP
ncbi:MAG: gas vesicle protein [Myxococcales bacterium]|jgi:hypothetical protein